MKRELAAIFLMSASVGGCAVVQEKTIGQSFDDATASNHIKGALLKNSAQKFAEVDVEVTGGLALLTGRVVSEEDKVVADKIAWSARKIDEVANEIEVLADTSLLKNVNDEWVTAQVRTRLLGDAAIKGINYNIETFNGVVYLLGVARDEMELKRAAEHASLVRGVDRVVSYVKIRDLSAPPEGSYSAQYERRQNDAAAIEQQGYEPRPASPPVDEYYATEGLSGGYSAAPPEAEAVPFIDPANPNDVYDENGYLISPSPSDDLDLEGGYSHAYVDPFADPFGDNGSSN